MATIKWLLILPLILIFTACGSSVGNLSLEAQMGILPALFLGDAPFRQDKVVGDPVAVVATIRLENYFIALFEIY